MTLLLKTPQETLETLPPEIVTRIADFLNVKDCGSLCMTSQEMHSKCFDSFGKHLAELRIDFHPLRLAELCIHSQSPRIARAVRKIRIRVLNDRRERRYSLKRLDPSPESPMPAGPNARHLHSYGDSTSKDTIITAARSSCCITGACCTLMTTCLRRLPRLQHLQLVGDRITLDHLQCSRPSCHQKGAVHHVLPAVLDALRLSGIDMPKLSIIEEGHGYPTLDRPVYRIPRPPRCTSQNRELDTAIALGRVRELQLVFGQPYSPTLLESHEMGDEFAVIRNMIAAAAAPRLSTLSLGGRRMSSSRVMGLLETPLFVRGALRPARHLENLRALTLHDDAVSQAFLAGFFGANPQLQTLELRKLILVEQVHGGGCWIDVLQFIRNNLRQLRRFAFTGNVTHQATGAVVRFCTRWDHRTLHGPLGHWDEGMEGGGTASLINDDGALFDSFREKLGGIGPALDLMIEGYH